MTLGSHLSFNFVQGFVHLYHIWGLWGLTTALIYGRFAFNAWREQGGSWKSAPKENIQLSWYLVTQTLLDWLRVFKWAFTSLLGIPYQWRVEPSSWKYSQEQSILLGIILGGTARILIASYWSAANTKWAHLVEPHTLLIPAIFVFCAIMGDSAFHIAYWWRKPWIPRLLFSGAMLWVALGLFQILPTI